METDLLLAAAMNASVLVSAVFDRQRSDIAHTIHDRSVRRGAAWVTVCGRVALPDDLDAAFARARGGTVFIDRIEALTAPAQTRLFELLDARISGNGRARVIAGAVPMLWDAVVDGRFSARLFYRLNAIRIDVATRAT